MKRLAKILLITAAIVFTIGIVLVITGFMSGGRITNIDIFGGNVYEYEDIDKDFSGSTIENLDLEIETGILQIVEGDSFRVEGTDIIEGSIEVGVKNNTLYIKEKDHDVWGWFKHIGAFNKQSVVTVTVPKDFVAKNTEVEVDAGKLEIDKLATDVLDVNVQAGKATINKLTVNSKASIDVEAGSVNGEDYNGKNLEVEVSAGSCDLTGMFTERLDLECSAGAINIDTALAADEYSYNLEQSAGSIRVNGDSYKQYDGKNTNATNSIVAKTSAGTIKIETK